MITFVFLILAGVLGILALVVYALGYFKAKKRLSAQEDTRTRTDPSLQRKYMDLLQKMVNSLSHNYLNLEIIAEGGMGVIASAWDEERRRKVAIKTILPELSEDTGVVELFLQECQVIQAMNHPNVIRIFEVGETDVLYFYVMDFLEGQTLQEIIDQQKTINMETTIRIGTQVARALQHIHSNGLIHRDIKPSNIFITLEGVAKIMDFGVAKLLHATTQLQYSRVGSPIYASPEQYRGEDVTGKSDIYSLGVCLFYMLSGQHPFVSTDLLDKMFEKPRDLRKLNHEVPEKLWRIIQTCLHADARKRLPAHELWARLRAIA